MGRGRRRPRGPDGAQDLFGYDLGDTIPTLEQMPILKEFVHRYKASQPLRGVTALLIQHQLGNQAPQAEALIALGLDPSDILWLDIPYTSSARFRTVVADRLKIPEGSFWVHRYRVLEPYWSYQLRRTQELVRLLLRRKPKRLLVLDDGAYFLEAAVGFRQRLRNVSVVEQTTRGLIKIGENAALNAYAKTIPVVNVARSDPKLELESPWIAVAVRAALRFHLDRLANESPLFAVRRDSRCLVLGYGAIGRRVADLLRGLARVTVFDSDAARCRDARRDGFRIWNRADIRPQFKLVVGCSGRASFGVGDYVYLERQAVLVSASSGSVELSRSEFIDLAAASHIDDIKVNAQWLHEDQIHQSLPIDVADHQVVFLNAGFPINFDGRVNCVPVEYMQPTAVLMVQGAIQAVRASQGRLIPINKKFSANLRRSFIKTLTPIEQAELRK